MLTSGWRSGHCSVDTAAQDTHLFTSDLPINGYLNSKLLTLGAVTFWARNQNYNASNRENRETTQVGEAWAAGNQIFPPRFNSQRLYSSMDVLLCSHSLQHY